MKVVVFDEASGEIIRTGYAPIGQVHLQAGPGEDVIPGEADDTTQYVDLDTLAVASKPEMSVTVDGTVVVAPPGVKFSVSGPAFTEGVADGTGTLQFNFDEPGEYTVRLELFPYLPAEVTIHAG